MRLWKWAAYANGACLVICSVQNPAGSPETETPAEHKSGSHWYKGVDSPNQCEAQGSILPNHAGIMNSHGLNLPFPPQVQLDSQCLLTDSLATQTKHRTVTNLHQIQREGPMSL